MCFSAGFFLPIKLKTLRLVRKVGQNQREFLPIKSDLP